ncbi:hypothetical protein HYV87_02265 [Candidatus Woesearchaeota archaeon]|nr:hypothetical protein [Candidatus Woesearchaeota archaeon]MBI2581933.1 hypothetical protein [Candidatus Woesearchaeota archaeon]
MMDIRKTRTCERCKNVVLLDQVRLYPKSDNKNFLVCVGCCEELKKASAGLIPSDLKAKGPAPILMKYNCTRCNYNFKADNSRAGLTYNLHCPYCGKMDRLQKIKARESSAEPNKFAAKKEFSSPFYAKG